LIGGVIVFGGVGFFLGPVVLALTLTILEVWRLRAPGPDMWKPRPNASRSTSIGRQSTSVVRPLSLI